MRKLSSCIHKKLIKRCFEVLKYPNNSMYQQSIIDKGITIDLDPLRHSIISIKFWEILRQPPRGNSIQDKLSHNMPDKIDKKLIKLKLAFPHILAAAMSRHTMTSSFSPHTPQIPQFCVIEFALNVIASICLIKRHTE